MRTCPHCKRPRTFPEIAASVIPEDEQQAISLKELSEKVYDGASREKATIFAMAERTAVFLKSQGRALRRKYVRHGRSFQVYFWQEPLTPRGKQ